MFLDIRLCCTPCSYKDGVHINTRTYTHVQCYVAQRNVPIACALYFSPYTYIFFLLNSPLPPLFPFLNLCTSLCICLSETQVRDVKPPRPRWRFYGVSYAVRCFWGVCALLCLRNIYSTFRRLFASQRSDIAGYYLYRISCEFYVKRELRDIYYISRSLFHSLGN